MNAIYYRKTEQEIILLRFYEGNEVYKIVIPNNKEPFDLPWWFTKDNYNEFWSKGQYMAQKGLLYFSMDRKFFEGHSSDSKKIEFIIKEIGTYRVIGNEEYNKIDEPYITKNLGNHRFSSNKDDTNNLRKLDFVNQDTFYPIVLISSQLAYFSKLIIPPHFLYRALGLDLPQKKLHVTPLVPKDYIYEEAEKKIFRHSIVYRIITLPITLAFAYMFFASLESENPLLSIFFLLITVFFSYDSFRYYTQNYSKEVKLPTEEYNELVNEYRETLIKVKRDNEILIKEYDLKMKEITDYVNENYSKALDKLHLEKTKSKLTLVNSEGDITRGRSEKHFRQYLIRRFNKSILEEMVVEDNLGYCPDFIFRCEETGFHIDIEIDEPYTLKELLPIHHIESSDTDRNEFFRQNNWGVIRFTENQVINYPEECCDLIESVIQSVRAKESFYICKIPLEERWTLEEAKKRIETNFRKQ